MTRILLLILGLIVYGSLYPWEYRPGPEDKTALEVLLQSWPAKVDRADLGDIAVNVLLYLPAGMFAFFALDRFGYRRMRWVLPGLIGFAVSSSIEMLQVFDRTRVPSLLDVLDNTLGSVAGLLLGYVLRSSFTGATLLVLYWLGFQLSALFAMLAGKRSYPHWTALVLAAWVLVLYMLSVSGKAVHRAWVAWCLAAGFLVLLLASGLAPYHLQAHGTAFHWIPFHAMFQADWIVGLPIFLEKSFYYGAAIWLLHRAGVGFAAATTFVAAVLAFIEVTQRFLPGRTPEITDPVIAVILGCMLWLIEQDASSRQSIVRL